MKQGQGLACARIAVVGIGYWGKNIVRVCHELGVLGAICDHDSKKTDLFSYEYEVAIKTWTQILSDPQITAVAIILPAHLHEKYAMEALNAGKHVFVEKPMAMSYSMAVQLTELAQKNNKVLMVGHILQYHAAYLKLKELVAQGLIGDIKYIESTRLHLGPVRAEIGIIWELIPHDLSMLLGLVKSPVKNIKLINQSFYSDKQNLNTADIIDVNLAFANDIKARVYSSWLHPNKEQKFWVAGTKGMLIFEDTQAWDNKLKLFTFNPNQSPTKQAITLEPQEPLKAELQDFIHCMQNNVIPKSDAYEGCRVVRLLEQISHSYTPLVVA